MDLRKVYLFRTRFEDAGTFGLVQYGSNFCRSLRLLAGQYFYARCLASPVGDYECRLIRSPKFGGVYGHQRTRTHRNLIHSGKFRR